MSASPAVEFLVLGARGRLGALITEVSARADVQLRPYVRGDDLAARLVGIQCAIDVTTAGSTQLHVRACAAARVPLVVATTGMSADDERALDDAARVIPVLAAANLSLSAHVAAHAVRVIAMRLPGADVEVVETHHRLKKDAPSGTALMLARAAATARGQGDEVLRRGRDGHAPRATGEIGVSAVRGGDVVGEHTVLFLGDGERIEIVHRVTDRRIFARGAVEAADWLRARAPGRYQMSDVVAGAVEDDAKRLVRDESV